MNKLIAATMCGLCLLIAGALAHRLGRVPSGAAGEELRYLRAVYLLQSLGGPAATERVTIPPRVVYDDETESLLHHPDKIQVLRRVAEDLAEAGASRPEAGLYEAYARLGLGEKKEASALLMRHVVEHPYNAGHYALLCRTLYEQEDYTSLLIICREWRERDAACREDRVRYAFAALYNLGRHHDAEAGMEGEEDCLGWRAAPFAAKARLASGDAEGAENLLRKAAQRRPDDAGQIQRLWERLKGRSVM